MKKQKQKQNKKKMKEKKMQKTRLILTDHWGGLQGDSNHNTSTD